jgi:hypothetical protein
MTGVEYQVTVVISCMTNCAEVRLQDSLVLRESARRIGARSSPSLIEVDREGDKACAPIVGQFIAEVGTL